jgi:hypothetical protein
MLDTYKFYGVVIMKKIVTPIIITLLVGLFIVLYTCGILYAFKASGFPMWILVLVSIMIMGLLTALIYTLYKRIKEIKEENDDDISKY